VAAAARAPGRPARLGRVSGPAPERLAGGGHALRRELLRPAPPVLEAAAAGPRRRGPSTTAPSCSRGLRRHWRDLVDGLCGAYGERGPALAARGRRARRRRLRAAPGRAAAARPAPPRRARLVPVAAHARLRLLRRALRR
jgi:hypothetical protein